MMKHDDATQHTKIRIRTTAIKNDVMSPAPQDENTHQKCPNNLN